MPTWLAPALSIPALVGQPLAVSVDLDKGKATPFARCFGLMLCAHLDLTHIAARCPDGKFSQLFGLQSHGLKEVKR